MTQKSILTIGAGIGGLSTGCYAQMNGYDVRVLEMHTVPGGMCAAWQRDGYTFDGCIHNLTGSCPDSLFHEMWRELGVVPAIRMRRYEEIVQAERVDGEPLTVYTDLDRLAAHMKQLAPADTKVIDELINAAHLFTRFDIMGLARASLFERVKAVRYVLTLIRYGGMTMGRFAQRFTDPFLRRVFPTLLYDWPQQPMLVFLSFLGRSHVGDLAWPVGGSANFSHQIEKRFRQLGGEVVYGAQVTSILTENDRAVGVRLADGSEERADIVISNGYGPTTIFDMLGGKYVNSAIRAYYDEPEDRIEMGIHVSLGVARDLADEPHAIVLPLAEPVVIADELRNRFYVEPFGFEPGFALPGKSALKVVFATSYKYWKQLHADLEAYTLEKHKIAETVIEQLERRFPGIRQQVEVIDVATPMTTQRFTGNGHGFKPSWNRMLLAMFTGRRLGQTLPGLKNFYMVGQWAGLPGLPFVAAMGRDVAEAICRHDGKIFASSTRM